MFYQVHYATGINEIGATDTQVEGFKSGVSLEGFHFFKDIPRSGELDFELRLPPLVLNVAAKATDLLRQSHFGDRVRLFSPKAQRLICAHNMDASIWAPVDVYYRDRRLKYCALYMIHLRQEFIDWERSTFSLVYTNQHDYSNGTLTPLEIKELELSNYSKYLEHMRSLMGKPQTIRAKQLNLITQIPFDIFKMSSPALGVYISERLKREIEKEGLTGFAFKGI